MNKQELQSIIDQLTANYSEANAFFGILQYGGGVDESYIEANEEGLTLFAIELLKASRDAQNLADAIDEKVYIIELHDDVWLKEGDVSINYIKPSLAKRSQRTAKEEYRETWKDVGLAYGCLGLIGVGFVLTLIGLITTIQWIF